MATRPPDSASCLCSECARELPIEQFRRRRKGSDERLRQCRECHNQRERERRILLRLKGDARRTAQFASALASVRDADCVVALCRTSLDVFGGLEGLTTAWANHLRTVTTEAPGSYKTLQSFRAVMQLIAAAERTC